LAITNIHKVAIKGRGSVCLPSLWLLFVAVNAIDLSQLANRALKMRIMIPAWVDGMLTPVEKLEVHQRGLRHKAISVFILRGTEVLLQRRALEKYHTPGLWANACCTHPAWEEPSDECAIRRLGEELGVKITDLDFRETLEYRADVGGGLTEHEVVAVFIAQADSNLRIAPNPDEVMDFEWVEYADLQKRIADTPDVFTPWLRIYMADFAETIFGTGFGSK
jgi:isopentenyl-diphosphate delta-isomerase